MEHARFTERALRLIWQSQLIPSRDLVTSDGRTITVVFAGRPNSDSGPDFLDAILRIGGTVYRGDVEIHRESSSWFAHGHHLNPAYNRVILHVVEHDDEPARMARTSGRRSLPLLILHSCDAEHPTPQDGRRPGPKCPLDLPVVDRLRILSHLGERRLHLRVARLGRRLRQLIDERRGILREPRRRYRGDPASVPTVAPTYTPSDFVHRGPWEQLLYEIIMECLGLEKNRDPFLRLARSVTLEFLRACGLTVPRNLMAVLFGHAGLLPSIRRIPEKESRQYVLDLKRRRRNLPALPPDFGLTESSWRFFRLRPANFPTARIAAICFLIPRFFGDQSFRPVVDIFDSPGLNPRDHLRMLRALFTFTADSFWQRHLHFLRSGSDCGITIGAARVGDVIINGLIPFIMLYAVIFHNRLIHSHALKVFRAHAPLQGNTVTTYVERELFRDQLRLRSAREQQGAIQLYRTCCRAGKCADCPLALSDGNGQWVH